MTVEQMIEFLRTFPQHAVVRAKDADTDEYVPITAMIYDGVARAFVDMRTGTGEDP